MENIIAKAFDVSVIEHIHLFLFANHSISSGIGLILAICIIFWSIIDGICMLIDYHQSRRMQQAAY